MDYQEKARRVISLEVEELNALLARVDESFESAIHLLKNGAENKGKILVVGVGKSGIIGNKIAATFSSTGAPASVLHCQDALHGDLGLVNEGDIVIALSYSGETVELLNVLPHLRRRGAKVIAITKSRHSQLGKGSDCVLEVEVSREACPLNLAPTSSSTNTLVMGDALAMVLLEARGFSRDDFAALHPGGSLGRALLLRARDIMRKDSDLVVVPETATVDSAIAQMTAVRAGAVVVVGADQKLSGVFTQGDFVRSFQDGVENLASCEIRGVMTPDPIFVDETRLVGEVLRLLENNRIDDLVVVNKEGKPVGLIDTQDLTRVQVV